MVYRIVSADDEGYMALAISILTYVTPDEAFRKLDGKCVAENRKWTPMEICKIGWMREEGMTWRDIGNAYGMKATAVQRAYSYHRRLEND